MRTLFSTIFFIALLGANGRAATVVDLSTPGNASDWRITAAGAVDAPSFQTNINRAGSISILDGNTLATSNNFVIGASLSNYNGFWYAENSFFLPSGATDVRLDFAGLFGNDRVVLSLNGTAIGNATVGGGTGAGVMRLVESGSDLPFTFAELTSGSIVTGFIIGGMNSLRLTVNNTGINFLSPTVASAFPNDGTVATLAVANLSFTAIPEPSSVIFCMLAAFSGFASRRRLGSRRAARRFLSAGQVG